jgi:hypothetical protein
MLSTTKPEARFQQDRVVRLLHRLPLVQRSLPFLTCAFGAQALTSVNAASNLVPDLNDEKKRKPKIQFQIQTQIPKLKPKT